MHTGSMICMYVYVVYFIFVSGLIMDTYKTWNHSIIKRLMNNYNFFLYYNR